jgi:DNA-binding protein HU-beta
MPKSKKCSQVKFIGNLRARLFADLELTAKDTKLIFDAVIETVKELLDEGKSLRLGELGKISLKKRAASSERKGRNPATGESITIPAKPETSFYYLRKKKVGGSK